MKNRRLSRSTVILAACILAVPTVPDLIYGAGIWNSPVLLKAHLAAGLLLGIAHILIRPVLRLITLPLGCLTFGLSGTAIDVGLIYLAAEFVDGYAVPDMICAVLTALMINAVSSLGRR